MAGFQRAIGRRAIRHADVLSKTHQKDVEENNARRKVYWIGVKQDLEDQHRILPALGGGLYYVRDHPLYGAWLEYREKVETASAQVAAEFAELEKELPAKPSKEELASLNGDQLDARKADLSAWVNLEERKRRQLADTVSPLRKAWRDAHTGQDTPNFLRVSGESLVKRLDCWREDLSYRYIYQKDPKCKLGYRWRLASYKSGLQGHVITSPPWVSNTLYEMAEKGDADGVKGLCEKVASKLIGEYEGATHRRVVSIQSHFDTTSLHWHLFSTRLGADHKFLPLTTDGLGLIGPWACGVLRQTAEGILPETSTNSEQATGLMQRTNKGKPLDWMLCRVVDDLCRVFLGASPRLTHWRRVYKQGFVTQCVNRLMELRDATSREIERVQTSCDYESSVGFGNSVNGGGREVILK